ncbi:hypothetical protein ExPCM16_03175 [Escherichia coli]|nr:hypothetical protein ExPCM16_03175 [Escherichia coli]
MQTDPQQRPLSIFNFCVIDRCVVFGFIVSIFRTKKLFRHFTLQFQWQAGTNKIDMGMRHAVTVEHTVNNGTDLR